MLYLPSKIWSITGGNLMPRRGENIYKRKDGRWEGRYKDGYDVNGKIIYKSIYAHSYSEIKEKLRQHILNPNPPKHEDKLLSDYALQWLESVKISRKISTYNKYKTIYLLHIKSVIGEFHINFINGRHIEKIINNAAMLSAKTQNDIICVIKMILEYAAQNGETPNFSMKGYSIKQKYKYIRVLSVEEQRKLTDFLLNDRNLIKIGIYLSLCTGLRIGELCALQKGNINLDTGELFVCKTLQRVQIENGESKTKVIITEPKSINSIRNIPLPEFLTDICRCLYKKLKPEDFLLTGTTKYMEPRALQYHFKKYIKDCDIEDLNFHALRHTFATRCVENGFEIKTLSEILGHVNVNITLNRYVHSSIDLKRANMEKLNSVF